MGQELSKVKPVIELKGRQPVYRKEAVREMVKNGPAKDDIEVFVICISGIYRSGKSFFLNLLKIYLDYYSEHGTDSGWTGSGDIKIEGGNWAEGQDTVTHGVWMYMYPKLINNKAIILMDCQGNKDPLRSTPSLDNLILFLGLQLSDIHILNVTRNLGADDLDRLGLCVYHADDECSGNIFERQIFLIRDWANRAKPRQLDELAALTDSKTVKDTVLGIQKAFRQVEVTPLPHPGPGVDGKSEVNGIALADVQHEFLQEVRKVFHRLAIRLPSEARMNRQQFLERFEFASTRSVGKISTSQEAYEESLIKDVFNECSRYFAAEVEKLNSGRASMTRSEMEAKVTATYWETVSKFAKHKRVENCKNTEIKIDYEDYLERDYTKTKLLMGHMVEVENLNTIIREKMMDEEAAKAKVKSLEEHGRRYQQRIAQLEADLANAATSTDTASLRRQLAEERQAYSNTIRVLNEAVEERKKARETIAKAEKRRDDVQKDMKKKLKQPTAGQHLKGFLKCGYNATFGKFFGKLDHDLVDASDV